MSLKTWPSAVLCLLLTASITGNAADTAIYLENPEYKFITIPPEWLTKGNGDDGYVSVTARVEMNNKQCIPIPKPRLLKNETFQAALTISSRSFGGPFAALEIPISTVDGVGHAGECLSLSTLPFTIYPYSSLPSFTAGNPGDVTISAKFISNTQTNIDIIGPAQILIGAASVFATGGASLTLASASSKLANPLLTPIQKKLNELGDSKFNMSTSISQTWEKMRNAAISTATLPIIYTSDSKRFAVGLLRLDFSYRQTIFPLQETNTTLTIPEGLDPKAVLGYPGDGSSTIRQAIAGDDFATTKKILAAFKAGNDVFRAECAEALVRLKNRGLAELDRGVALKIFLEDASGEKLWPHNNLETECFGQRLAEKLQAASPKVDVSVKNNPDIQTSDSTEFYSRWYEWSSPLFLALQSALTAETDRIYLIAQLTQKQDIPFSANAPSEEWVASKNPAFVLESSLDNDQSLTQWPNLRYLTQGQFKAVGCLMAPTFKDIKDTEKFGLVYFLNSHNEVWRAEPFFEQTANGRKLTQLNALKIDATYYASLEKSAFNRRIAAEDSSQCTKIRRRMKELYSVKS